MYKVLFTAIIAFSMFACSTQEEKAVSKKEDQVENQQNVQVEADRLLTIELEGMVCQMGCGGAIRKAMNATGAVESCEFDFEEERAVDVAKIAFDKDKITVDEIVKIVSEINDGQFSIKSTHSEEFVHVNTNEDVEHEEESEITDVNVTSSPSIGLPNFFDLFSGLFL
jgi:hypothetical protein